MAYEVRPNTGSLFKNDKKETDSHPDYKGSGLIEGVGEVWLDAWINTSNNGTKYMSLKFKRKDAAQTGSYARQEPQRSPADLDDDVPF
jgi:uncharacterized protein (DUF736 family)